MSVSDINKGASGVNPTAASTGSVPITGGAMTGNLSAPNVITGLTKTTASGGTLTLDVNSNYQQTISGSSAHTVVLPVVSTLQVGQGFLIRYIGTGSSDVTINSSGGSLVTTISLSGYALVVFNGTAGTGSSSWDVLLGTSGGVNGGSVMVRNVSGNSTINALTYKSVNCAKVELTDAATVSLNLTASSLFNLTTTSAVGATRQLGVPSNVSVGQSGIINVRQDSAGSRALTFAWPYIFSGLTAPTMSPEKYALDKLSYIVDSYATATATMTIATPCVVTWTGHGLVSGQRVAFTTTGALPTGITANTGYYVNVIDANTFNLSTTLPNLQAATYVATSGSQSGTHTATNMAVSIVFNPNMGA